MLRYSNPEHTTVTGRREGEFIPADHPDLIGQTIAAYEPDLAQERKSAIVYLYAAVSRARTKYAPTAEHQTVIYDVKAQEADAYVLAGRPADASAFPLLVASAAANNRAVSDHADMILSKRDAWIQVAAATERLREEGENAIRAASDMATITATRDAYVAQLEAI